MRYPLLLDGGLSNQLEAQGCDINHYLWTAKILQEDPGAIVEAHLAYLEAGAQCLITSSYQASLPGFMQFGLTADESEYLLLKSVDLAREAIGIFQAKYPNRPKAIVAASIGPYGAYLADGSEYSGNYELSDSELKEFHLSRIRVLDGSSADVLACETIPSIQEARVLIDILHSCKKKSWMTFSCKDETHISDGNKIETAVQFLCSSASIFALGVNCTKPRFISGLIKNIRGSCSTKKIIVYPNSGEMYDATSKCWIKGDDVLFNAELVKEWLSLGADMIGGCCRVGPDKIKQVSEQIPEFDFYS